MLVISHDKEAYSGNPRFSSVVDDWTIMQKSIADLSSNSEHVIAKGATHNIPGDSPELVVSKVLETVKLVTGNTY
tara:strand:- start:541 stop:765 length:225 start_codon:yes stop_codon:yes gene_type:complete